MNLLAIWAWMGVATAKPVVALSLRVVDPVQAVMVTARAGAREPPVLLTDDGSLRVDTPGDSVWWAYLELSDDSPMVILSGTLDGAPLLVREDLSDFVGSSLTDQGVVPLTFSVHSEAAGWVGERVDAAPLVPRPTGRALRGSLFLGGLAVLALVAGVLVPVRRRPR